MARQAGIFPLEGTIGNVNFYRSIDGYLVRRKGGASADKIQKDPTFERTRENMSEFGRASTAARLLRSSLRPLIQHAADCRMVSRLHQRMLSAIRADTVSPRGQRNATDGDMRLLKGFTFNMAVKPDAILFIPYAISFTRSSGVIMASFEPFIAAATIAAPPCTTYFRISLAASAVDFDNGGFHVATTESAYYRWAHETVAAFNLSIALPAASGHPVFCVLLLEFVQEANGTKRPLPNGCFNAASIVDVFTV
ncbi:MAG TPA: hypothetical protein PKM63_17970 [Panacibacter sp.]|nr:hypothetical protein [Panacibacter sp.]HNP46187.1 hypothetical protein [Panacibacter sp.]